MRRVLLAVIGALLAVRVVSAHLVGGGGLLAGLTHPLFGFDHLLAILSVGILAGRSEHVQWRLPVLFVVSMLVGGLFGMLFFVPFVEAGIVLSVILLGLLVAFHRRLSDRYLYGIIGLAALFHGHAHGTELPLSASPWLYALGFGFATFAAHSLSAFLTSRIVRYDLGVWLVRASGAGIAALGVLLF